VKEGWRAARHTKKCSVLHDSGKIAESFRAGRFFGRDPCLDKYMRTVINPALSFILVHRIENKSGFGDYFLHQEYTKIAGPGKESGEIRDITDWEKFRPMTSRDRS